MAQARLVLGKRAAVDGLRAGHERKPGRATAALPAMAIPSVP